MRLEDKQQSKSKKRPPSVSTQFIQQVDELMRKLYACKPHYVRCLKPNEQKRSNFMEEDMMRNQVNIFLSK